MTPSATPSNPATGAAAPLPPAAATPPAKPRFVTGSLMRHVTVMAGTGAIGLVAVFVVDLINLFYLSLLGESAIAAAVGFAGVVAFFHLSLSIGLTIAVSAVVSRTLGSGNPALARRVATSSLVLMTAVTLVIGSGTALFLEPIMAALGASGETARLAVRYLSLTVHSLPLIGIAMACSALLRSVGAAQRAMMVTLGGALLTAALDPLLIFGLGMRLDGAALAVVLARLAMAAIGLHGVLKRYKLLGPFEPAHLAEDAKALWVIAGPAVLTNLATPVGGAFVTHAMAQFGPSAVAGQATIDRLTPVAFGLVYSLSGAVGPILAQNLGAGEFGRVREGLRACLVFTIWAVAGAWALLALGQGLIIQAFAVQGEAALLIRAFCSVLAASFFFIGALFVANAAFNNLGRPLWSTGFNWARATLGTIPFAYVGGLYFGPVGVLAGQALGAVLFGSLALWAAYWLTQQLGAKVGRYP